MGVVSEGGSFFSKSPQQMSLHDSLVQTESLYMTILPCAQGDRICWLLLANYCGPWNRVNPSPQRLGENMTAVMPGRKILGLLMKGNRHWKVSQHLTIMASLLSLWL